MLKYLVLICFLIIYYFLAMQESIFDRDPTYSAIYRIWLFYILFIALYFIILFLPYMYMIIYNYSLHNLKRQLLPRPLYKYCKPVDSMSGVFTNLVIITFNNFALLSYDEHLYFCYRKKFRPRTLGLIIYIIYKHSFVFDEWYNVYKIACTSDIDKDFFTSYNEYINDYNNYIDKLSAISKKY